MTKRMLIDATHPEETRVVVVSGTRLEDFDVEVATRKQLKGNIYLAKVTRVEPSLQAAFVDYGGNRHGFLAFSEIHPDYYQIPVEDRRALLAADAADARAAAERATRAEAAGAAPDIDKQHREDENDSRQDQGEDRAEGADETSGDAAPAEFTPAPEGMPSQAFEHVESEGESPAPTETAGEPSEYGIEFAPPPVEESGEGPRAEHGEAAPAENGNGEANGGEQRPKPASVEILGGDSDDDLEVRRPSAARRHYKIQEVIKRRQIMLVQVVKEERGGKGAALTTYLSLAGRYCVLMPNTARGGGISRKIAGGADRKRLKSVVGDLSIPDGMAVIVRTAGAERTKTEIQRDYEYLSRAWSDVRERTLESIAPALVYEEGSIIKRAIRDLYSNDVGEVIVAGEQGYRTAKDLMRHLVPSHAKKVRLYQDPVVSLLRRYQVEDQLALIHNPRVQLRSGGYIVINPTEALVSIDVNSGRATRERHIEETALRTNLEAAEEIARQLRLRDLAGLIVIDFIDMESSRNQMQVERRLKESMRHDRARIQIGRISHFGLLEMSRQRLRPSLAETSSVPCPHCDGTGLRRSTDSSALAILRAIEEEGVKQKADEITVYVASAVALYILNQKRATLTEIERRFLIHVVLVNDDTLIPPAHRIERTKARTGPPLVIAQPEPLPPDPEDELIADEAEDLESVAPEGDLIEVVGERADAGEGRSREGRPREDRPREDRPREGRPDDGRVGEDGRPRRRRRRGRGRGRDEARPASNPDQAPGPVHAEHPHGPSDHDSHVHLHMAQDLAGAPQPDIDLTEDRGAAAEAPGEARPRDGQSADGEGPRRKRRRGRRGGRNRRRPGEQPQGESNRGTPGEAQPVGVDHDAPRPRETGPRHDAPRHDAPRHDAPRHEPQRPAPDAHREFRVTTPAEAGIAFLDGPSFGTFHDHGDDEQDTPPPKAAPVSQPAPRPEPRPEPPRETFRAPEPKAEPKPEPAPQPRPVVIPVVVPAAPPETPEERERRIRASKTEVVEVTKTEGQPAKSGWWRRGR